MKAHDLDPFCSLFQDLLLYLPHNRAVTPDDAIKLAEGYFEELAELNLEQVAYLFRLARRECQWFPTIAWLRDKAGLEPEKSPREQLETLAEQVWQALVQPEHDPLTGKWRAYRREVVEADPIARQLVREMGAGYDFNRWAVDQIPHKKREFLQGYVALWLTQQRRHRFDQGLSHDDAAAFLRDSGLGQVCGGMNGSNGHAHR